MANTNPKSKSLSIAEIDDIEERASETDRLAHELYLTGERLSPLTNQLHHFVKPTPTRFPGVDKAIRDRRARYRRIAKRALAWPDEPVCIRCGCTEMHACEGGCSWIFLDEAKNRGLCSSCFEILALENRK